MAFASSASATERPPNRVERLLARASILKLDPAALRPAPAQPSSLRRRRSDSSASSIEEVATQVRRSNLHTAPASGPSAHRLPPLDDNSNNDNTFDDDDGNGDDPLWRPYNVPPEMVNASSASLAGRSHSGDRSHSRNPIRKLSSFNLDDHPHRAAIHDAINRAPLPLRFFGNTVEFVGNTAVNVGRLPVDAIAKGIRRARESQPKVPAEAVAGEAARIGWEHVDPSFPQGYATTVLGLDETDQARVQAMHPMVTSHKLPKMYPYPTAVPWADAGLVKVRETFIFLYLAVFVGFSSVWYMITLRSVSSVTSQLSYFSLIAPIGFFARTSVTALSGILLCVGIAMVQRRIEKELESRRNTLFSSRAQALVPPMPESVEWLNASIAAVWNQIDPAIFVPLADQVEDVMQMSLPGFVNAVKVDDIGIGVHAFQLVALRSIRAKTPGGQNVDKAGDLASALEQEKPLLAKTSSNVFPGTFPRTSRPAPPAQDGTPTTIAGNETAKVPIGHPPKESGAPVQAVPQDEEGPAQPLSLKKSSTVNTDDTMGPFRSQKNGADATLVADSDSMWSEQDDDTVAGRERLRHKLKARVLSRLRSHTLPPPDDADQNGDAQDADKITMLSSMPPPNDCHPDMPGAAQGQSLQEQQINVQDESGGFVHLEASFSYSARKGSRRADNIHMMIMFYIGAMDLFQIPFPVWVNIEKVSGTLRLRAQLVSEPPYVRNVTFALMGVPRIEVSVVPMASKFVNVLDIPLVSDFVQSSIAAAANAYVAPQSMTLNVSDILSGDGVKKDTDAVGILAVHIGYARGLSSQDANGYSDPYIIISLAKFGRPLYWTRIIRRDLNPVWNEFAFVLITKNDVKNDEQLSIQLWDWDRHSPDDINGRVTRSVRGLMRKPNQWHTYTDTLRGFEEGIEMEGHLTYRVGFFDKAPLGESAGEGSGRAALEALEHKTHNTLDDVAAHLQQEEREVELQQRHIMMGRDEERESDTESVKGDKLAWKQKRADRARRAAIAFEAAETTRRPPNPHYPTGILSVLVEHIEGLENRDVERGVMGKDREGGQGQDIDSAESTKRIPCAYVEVLLNEVMVFRTRTKQYTNEPFFNAGTEVFVRDWRSANLTLCVRDARLREHDPIMGLVCLDLPDLFSTTSQVSRKFSLSDGVAFGKVQLSFVFRSVYLEIPRSLRGAENATLEILGPISFTFPPSREAFEKGGRAPLELAQGGSYEAWDHALTGAKLIVTVGDVTHKLDMRQYNPKAAEARSYLAQYTHSIGSHPSSGTKQGSGPSDDAPISLLTIPLFERYLTSAIFGINPRMGISTLSARRKCDAYAVQWLSDLPDCMPEGTPGGAIGGPIGTEQKKDEGPVTWVSLPIIAGPQADIAVGNYIGVEAAATHHYGVVGEMRIGLRLHPGFDLAHDSILQGHTDRHEWEVFNRLKGMPMRAEINSHAADDGIIDRHERAEIRRAKREALHARHRGAFGYSAVRSAAWAKDSVKHRLRDTRYKITGHAGREQSVQSEV